MRARISNQCQQSRPDSLNIKPWRHAARNAGPARGFVQPMPSVLSDTCEEDWRQADEARSRVTGTTWRADARPKARQRARRQDRVPRASMQAASAQVVLPGLACALGRRGRVACGRTKVPGTEVDRASRRPPKRRLRISAHRRVRQPVQGRKQLRRAFLMPTTATTLAADLHELVGLCSATQLVTPLLHRVRRKANRPRQHENTAVPMASASATRPEAPHALIHRRPQASKRFRMRASSATRRADHNRLLLSVRKLINPFGCMTHSRLGAG